ncbi:MAG: hypothetical protein AAAB13_04560 [Pseudomonas sp.]
MCPFCLIALAIGGASVATAGGVGLMLGRRPSPTGSKADER